MNVRKGILFLLVSFTLVTVAKAQDTQGPEQISLPEAIDIALENSNQLKIAENDVQLAEYMVTNEKADYFPSVNANMSGNRNIGRTFDQNTGEITEETNNSFRSSISANLPIFSGLENLHSLRSSQYDKRSGEENLQRVRENIIFNTANNYLQFILDQHFLEIDRENLNASRNTLEQVQAQVEVGARPQVDLFNQEAIVANNELAVVNSENAVQSSRLQLIQTLQIDPRKDYEFSTPEIQDQNVTAADYNLDRLVAVALENRSDLKRETLNIQSLEHQMKSTRGSLYPTLSLTGSLSSSYSELRPFDFQDQFFDQNIYRSFGLSLSIPIFANLDRRASVQTQQINY
ncbi:MAG TPA: TolC family protein, partial [Fodinibius sp.]|nr:TolC family protein [Fodinibius sp.]